ncbi:MAG: Glutamine--scyllo-inositol transaminase [Clostridia bacterium]|nr:Glutamine--scyllo-inositol transaminase [Clostridia bacterium]
MTLAAFGGKKAVTITPSPCPVYNEEEKAAIKDALNAEIWGTLGPQAMTFAQEFAEYCGAEHSVSVNNGSVGLEIILKGLEIGYGDEVILPAYAFNSTLSAVAVAGAIPVFADIDENFNIDPNDVLNKINVKTKAVIAVHMGGYPADINMLLSICKKRGIFVIEDGSYAAGSSLNNKKVGSLADAAVFDFYTDENISSGEGGSITTNNDRIFKKVWEQHNSGRTYDDSSEFGGTVMCGTNARMAEFEAAILRCQLKRLDSQIQKRTESADKLCEYLKAFDFFTLRESNNNLNIINSYNLFIIRYNKALFHKVTRSKLVEILQAEGVPVKAGNLPLYKNKMLQTDYFKKSTGSTIEYNNIKLEKTELLSEEALYIPGHVLLTGLDYIEQIAAAFDKVSKNIQHLI